MKKIRRLKITISVAVLYSLTQLPRLVPDLPGIAEVLDMPPASEANREKNDPSTVRHMVKRGRKILEETFGEEEWREKVQTMRSETKRLVEQDIETCVAIFSWNLDVSAEEVRSHVVLDPVTGRPWLDQEYQEKLMQKMEEWIGKPRPKG